MCGVPDVSGTEPYAVPAFDAFESLVDDVASALDEAIPAWRVRLSAAAAGWRARDYDVRVLERALALPTPPDVDALLATFERAVRQLAEYEAAAVALDPALAGDRTFRDPARVRDAAATVAGARRARTALTANRPDPEHWVLPWPDVGDLLAGEFA